VNELESAISEMFRQVKKQTGGPARIAAYGDSYVAGVAKHLVKRE
jgi:hypothetical protein